jgi:hypothetical protein
MVLDRPAQQTNLAMIINTDQNRLENPFLNLLNKL